MRFYLNNANNINEPRENSMFLTNSDWDDWFTYSTVYTAIYYDNEGRAFSLGSIKIGQFNMENQRRPSASTCKFMSVFYSIKSPINRLA